MDSNLYTMLDDMCMHPPPELKYSKYPKPNKQQDRIPQRNPNCSQIQPLKGTFFLCLKKNRKRPDIYLIFKYNNKPISIKFDKVMLRMPCTSLLALINNSSDPFMSPMGPLCSRLWWQTNRAYSTFWFLAPFESQAAINKPFSKSDNPTFKGNYYLPVHIKLKKYTYL